MPCDPLELTAALVAIPSVSSQSNAAVSDRLQAQLQADGYEVERLTYRDRQGIEKVNVVGRKGPAEPGGVAYFAHTDVVPADTWTGPNGSPFTPAVHGDRLYGRGSCDMKGSLACFVAAASRVPANEMRAPVYVIATADEEVGFHGAQQVATESTLYQALVAGEARGIIGEPTELQVVHAHKGTYGFKATARGRAAHSSTREGLNANLAMIPFLAEMKRIHDETLVAPEWQHPEFDPPWISWNIGINDHTHAVNITAPQSVCTVYYRPMPGQRPDELLARAEVAATANGLEFEVTWKAGPLYTDARAPYVQELLQLTGCPTSKTVAYGTDGVMYSAVKQIVVLGPGSIRQAHTDDEFITLADLRAGTDLYTRLIQRWC